MKRETIRLVGIVLVFICSYTTVNAQKYEFGGGIGFTAFLGDLGGAQDIARPFIIDLDLTAFRPGANVFFRHTFHPKFAYKLSISAGQVYGADRFIYGGNGPTTELSDAIVSGTLGSWQNFNGNYDEWFRWIRNQRFKSPVFDVTGVIEFNILKYEPRNTRKRWTPYLQAGGGFLAFNPKGKEYVAGSGSGGVPIHDGPWVKLQPLGTEGQSNPALDEFGERKYEVNKYKRIAGVLILGGGIKYNVSRTIQIGIDLAHRMTTTDYIDDVSTEYIDPRDVDAYPPVNPDVDPDQLKWFAVGQTHEFYRDNYEAIGGYFTPQGNVNYAQRLAQGGYDPEYDYIEYINDYNWQVRVFGPGVQRGDPTDFDQFFTTTVTVSYMFGQNRYSCYFKTRY